VTGCSLSGIAAHWKGKRFRECDQDSRVYPGLASSVTDDELEAVVRAAVGAAIE